MSRETKQSEYRTHLPLYRQIAEMLEQEIQVGVAGDKLPPERELTERFGVSVITIKQALGLLENQGLIYRRARQGTFIRHAPRLAKTPVSQTLHWVQIQDLAHAGTVDQAIRDQFESTHPGWQLEISRPKAHQELPQFLEESLGHADVVSMNAGFFNQCLRRDTLLDLTDHLDERLSPEAFYGPARLVGCVGGRIWALPRMLNPTALYVNETLLREHGISPIEAAQTWENLGKALSALPTSRAGEKLWRFGYFRYGLLFWENFVLQNGGKIFGSRTNRCTMAEAETIAGLTKAMDFIHACKRDQTRDLSADSQPFLQAHAAADLACFMGGPLFASFLRDAKDHWCVLPLPAAGLPANMASSYQVGICRRSDNYAEAMDLLSLICGSFGQDLLGFTGAAMPANQQAARKYYNAQGKHDLSGFPDSADQSCLAQPWAYQPTVTGVLGQVIPAMMTRGDSPEDTGSRTAQVLNLMQLPTDELWLPSAMADSLQEAVLV